MRKRVKFLLESMIEYGFTPEMEFDIIKVLQKIVITLTKGDDYIMNEKEMIEKLIDKYVDLQRIKTAADPQKEIEYQITVTKAKLESCGIATSDFDIK